MSLILEALKKSEAERRLGQVPGLMTPVQRTAPRRASRGPLLIALLLAIALVAVAGWWWMQREAAPSAALDDARRAEAIPSVATPANPPPADATAVATPTPAAEPPASASVPDLPAEMPSDPDFISRERESRPVAANTPEPIDTAPPVPRLPSPASSTPAQAPRTTPSAPDATAQTAPTASIAPDVVPIPPPAEEALEQLPRLVDLPASERDGLPPLKLTMHVYAADAAARFVLIDGRRLGQGERLSPTLVLSEIRRDGAVFESDGHRFLIPRL